MIIIHWLEFSNLAREFSLLSEECVLCFPKILWIIYISWANQKNLNEKFEVFYSVFFFFMFYSVNLLQFYIDIYSKLLKLKKIDVNLDFKQTFLIIAKWADWCFRFF